MLLPPKATVSARGPSKMLTPRGCFSMKTWSVLLSLAFVFGLAGSVRGDVIVLRADKAAKWQASPLGAFVRVDGRGDSYIRGRIVTRGRPNDFIVHALVASGGSASYDETTDLPVKYEWVKRIKQELDSILDVEAVISNRIRLYGTAEEAFREVIRAIDQGSGVYFFSNPAAQTVPGAPPLLKGWLERVLGEGRLTNQRQTELRQELDALPLALQDRFYPYLSEQSPEDLVTALVEGHARALKYGPPEPQLEIWMQKIAQLVTERVAGADRARSQGATFDSTGPAGIAFRCRSFSARARSTIAALIAAGTPDAQESENTGATTPAWRTDPELPLTGEEVAASAMTFAQDLITPREDADQLVEALVGAAAGTGSAADVAVETLGTLVDREPEGAVDPASGGGVYRAAVKARISDPDPGRARAAQRAMLYAGFGSETELRRAVDDLFRIAVPAKAPVTRDDRLRRDTAILTLLRLRRARGRGDIRALAETIVRQRIAEVQARDASGAGGDGEKEFVRKLGGPGGR